MQIFQRIVDAMKVPFRRQPNEIDLLYAQLRVLRAHEARIVTRWPESSSPSPKT